MKKISLLALCLVLVMSFAGCNTGDTGKKFEDMTAYEHYVAVNEKSNELESLEMTYSGKASIGMPDMGVNMDMDFSGNSKQVIHSESDQDMNIDMTISAMGENIAMQMYYIDGVMYQNDGTNKVKYAMELADATEQAGLANSLNAMAFMEESVLSANMEDAEGGKKLIFELDPVMIGDMLSGIIDPMLASFEAEDMTMDVAINALTYEMVIDTEHNLKDMRMILSMDVDVAMQEMGSMTMTCDMDMSYTIVSTNTVTEIVLPDDPDSYTLMDSAGL